MRQNSLEDPPYATATRPIGESPRRVMKTQSLSITQKPVPLQRNSSVSGSFRHTIVTVHGRNTEEDTMPNDAVLQTLQKVPQFFPIIRETIRNPVMKEIHTTSKLDIQAAHSLVTKFQSVLKEGADSVMKNQQQLSQRVLDMDYAIGTLHQILQDKTRKLSKQTEQLSSIGQIRALLNSSRMCLSKTEETLNQINACLPLKHRLETLSLSLNLTPEHQAKEPGGTP